MNKRVAMGNEFNKAVLLLATGAPRLKSPTVGDFMAVGITHESVSSFHSQCDTCQANSGYYTSYHVRLAMHVRQATPVRQALVTIQVVLVMQTIHGRQAIHTRKAVVSREKRRPRRSGTTSPLLVLFTLCF